MQFDPHDPRGETTRVAEDLVAVLGGVMKRSQAPMVEFAERHDLNFTQLKLMFVLANAEAPLPIGQIAELTGGGLPATGRAVDGLVRHGLVDRSEDPEDRRVKLVRITRQGDEAMQAVFASRIAALREVLAKLSDEELSELGVLVASVRERLDEPAESV